MTELKTYGAIAIMIGCFVVIYPRFMHPIFLSMFGLREAPQKAGTPDAEIYPPGYKGHPTGPARGAPDDIRRHMRHGPHPGMRAAAEMQRQQGTQGSGRGMMGVVLPMYAVGIVLYLAYTLYKVFNKSYAKNGMNGSSNRYGRDRRGYYNREQDRMGFPRDFDGSQDIRNFLHDQEHRQNLEDLLTRVDDKNVSVEEMRVLQKRLEETEAQMTRILNAMHAVNANVDRMTNPESAVSQGEASADKENQDGALSVDQGKDSEQNTTHTSPVDAIDNTKPKEDKKETVDKEEEKTKENPASETLDEEEVEGEGTSDPVDELIEESKEDKEEGNESTVRQRNVKANEQ